MQNNDIGKHYNEYRQKLLLPTISFVLQDSLNPFHSVKDKALMIPANKQESNDLNLNAENNLACTLRSGEEVVRDSPKNTAFCNRFLSMVSQNGAEPGLIHKYIPRMYMLLK